MSLTSETFTVDIYGQITLIKKYMGDKPFFDMTFINEVEIDGWARDESHTDGQYLAVDNIYKKWIPSTIREKHRKIEYKKYVARKKEVAEKKARLFQGFDL